MRSHVAHPVAAIAFVAAVLVVAAGLQHWVGKPLVAIPSCQDGAYCPLVAFTTFGRPALGLDDVVLGLVVALVVFLTLSAFLAVQRRRRSAT